MPDRDDFHAYKSTSGGSGGSSGGGAGCAVWVVIGIVVVMLILFLSDGAGWNAIKGLLTWGFIAFLVAYYLMK